MYRIIEQKLVGKLDDFERCEDIIVTTDDLVAVIDGATGSFLSTALISGTRRGKWAAETLAAELDKIDVRKGVYETVNQLTVSFQEKLQKEMGKGYDDARPEAQITMYVPYWNEIWGIGDTVALTDTGETSFQRKIVDDVTYGMRALLIRTGLTEKHINVSKQEPVPGWGTVLNTGVQLSYGANDIDVTNPFRYGIMNGIPVPKDLIDVIKLPDYTREIALMSDGYPIPAMTLQEVEHLLAEKAKNDPYGIEEPYTHSSVYPNGSFDDRAYIRIERG